MILRVSCEIAYAGYYCSYYYLQCYSIVNTCYKCYTKDYDHVILLSIVDILCFFLFETTTLTVMRTLYKVQQIKTTHQPLRYEWNTSTRAYVYVTLKFKIKP